MQRHLAARQPEVSEGLGVCALRQTSEFALKSQSVCDNGPLKKKSWQADIEHGWFFHFVVLSVCRAVRALALSTVKRMNFCATIFF
jgi:hypothetical protein